MAFVNKAFEVDSIGPRDEVIHGILERYAQITKSVQKNPNEEEKKKRGHGLTASDAEREIVEIAKYLNDQLPTKPGVGETRRDRQQYMREQRLAKGDVRGAHVAPSGDEKDVLNHHTEYTLEYADDRTHMSRDGFTSASEPSDLPGEALIEMKGVKVQYGDKAVLGEWKQKHHGVEEKGLWWTISRGQRWGVFGPNGKSINQATYMCPH
jgi:hypothetical protein